MILNCHDKNKQRKSILGEVFVYEEMAAKAVKLYEANEANDFPDITKLVEDLTENWKKEKPVSRQSIKEALAEYEIPEPVIELIRQLVEKNLKLKIESNTDGLTGIGNRRYFEEKLENSLYEANRYKRNFSLLIIDLSNFKTLNDTYGHLEGDMVLKIIGRALEEGTRRSDIVARYGGDEFAAILPGTDNEGAMKAGEQIRVKIESDLKKHYAEKGWGIDEKDLMGAASVGVTTFDGEEENGSIIEKADAALYKAKEEGKNCVRSFAKLNPEEIERIKTAMIRDKLGRALEGKPETEVKNENQPPSDN